MSSTWAPNPTAGMPCFKGDENPKCPKGAGGIPRYPEEPPFLNHEMRFKNALNAVSIIDPDRGFPVERLWSVQGKPSASSLGADYWSAGSLRLLEPDETVTLGSSGMVTEPGTANEHAPGWVSLATLL